MTAARPVAFVPRAAPLAPRAAVARGEPARALAGRLLALADDELAALTAVVGEAAGAPVCVVLGPADALPWVDGVGYLGRDDAAPGLLVPTAVAPDVAPALLERAVRARLGAAGLAASVVAVVVDEPGAAIAALVPVGGARTIDRARLAAWHARLAAWVVGEGAR